MEINYGGMIIGILITCISYMLIPVILKLKNGCYEEEKAKKIALWNSVIIGAIYMILTIEMMGTSSTWSAGPAILYYGINYSLLKSRKKEKYKNNSGKIVLILVGIIAFIVVMNLIIKNMNDKSIDNSIDNSVDNKLRARHILVDDYETAKEIISLLDKGTNFCDLALEYSIDTATVDNCGDVGYFEEGYMVIEFEENVKKLKHNEYTSLPVQTDYGYHVIMRIK